MEDVFALQDRVAGEVAAVLDATIEMAEIRRATRRPTTDLDAYGLYLQPVSQLRVQGRETLARGAELADAAIQRDPNYAGALIVAALCRSSTYFTGAVDGAELTEE